MLEKGRNIKRNVKIKQMKKSKRNRERDRKIERVSLPRKREMRKIESVTGL